MRAVLGAALITCVAGTRPVPQLPRDVATHTDPLYWLSGAGGLSSSADPHVPDEEGGAFPMDLCPAPPRPLLITHEYAAWRSCLGQSIGYLRSYCSYLMAMETMPNVTVKRVHRGQPVMQGGRKMIAVLQLPEEADAHFSNCVFASRTDRSPRTWILMSKFFEQVMQQMTPGPERRMVPSSLACRCGCGPRRLRGAPLVQNRQIQQMWEMHGGTSMNLRLVEPRVGSVKCKARKLPRSRRITVCYQGFHMHGYDLIPDQFPYMLERFPQIQIHIISPAPKQWWLQAFETFNYSLRGVDVSRFSFPRHMATRGALTLWNDLEVCDVGLAPQYSYQGKTNYDVAYPHPDTRGGRWRFTLVSQFSKLAAHPGRAFMFTQLGIPVITESDPQSAAIFGELRLGVVLETQAPTSWAWALGEVLKDYEGMSRRSCAFEKYELRPEVEARKIVCWLRMWQDRIDRDPSAGIMVHPSKRADRAEVSSAAASHDYSGAEVQQTVSRARGRRP